MAITLSLLITACSSPAPGQAQKCGVADAQLREAIDEATQQKPYSSLQIGRCNLLNDDAKNVVVITPEIQREVENMIAREKAESGK